MSDSGKPPPGAVATDGSCFQCTGYFMRSCLVEHFNREFEKEKPHFNFTRYNPSSFSRVQESSWHLYMQKFMYTDKV